MNDNEKEIISIRMNDDPQLFHKTNDVTRKDAVYCLEEYSKKFRWENAKIKVMDVGSADGSVTNILCSYLPKNFEILIGCDVNKEVVKFANTRYGNERIIFKALDIEGDLPEELVKVFDYVFSFYTLHWLQNQEQGFQNIYNLLAEHGECLITVSGFSPMYSIFRELYESNKWNPWLKDIDKFISPYHDCPDADSKIARLLEKIGFHNIEVKCQQKVHVFDSVDVLKMTMKSINPFKIPKEMEDDFLDDLINVARDMRLVNNTNNTVKFNYNLIVIYCTKYLFNKIE